MPVTPIDRFAERIAPASWQAVDVISDLHLQAGEPATFEAWVRYLRQPAAERADALFILGDLFEVWVGDDVLNADASDTRSGAPAPPPCVPSAPTHPCTSCTATATSCSAPRASPPAACRA
jgi:hypothetical protein